MKLAILSCLLFVFTNTNIFSKSMSANEIMQRAYDREEGKTAISEVDMTLISKTGKKSRRFISLQKELKNGTIKTLISFNKPKAVNGTTLLTVDKKNSVSQQWLFLPAFKKIRRISTSGKGRRFVGSDVYYEDFDKREVSEDIHTRLKDSKYGNTTCYVIKSVPKDKSSTSYGHVMAWIHPKTFVVLKGVFYKNNKIHKILKAKDVKKVQNIWTIYKTEIFNRDMNHKTVLSVNKIKYNKPLKDSLFSQGKISKPKKFQAIVKKTRF